MDKDFDFKQQSDNASDAPSIDYIQVLKNRYGIVLLTLLLVFLASVIITYVMPKKYSSEALVQVLPSRMQIDPFNKSGNQFQIGAIQSRKFFETEYEVIKSEETLKLVSERLNLQTVWEKDFDQVISTLKSIVSTEAKRQTDLIKIKVTHTEKEEAKSIAEEITNQYAKRRNSDEINRAEKALQALDNELRNQQDRVEEKRKVLDTLVRATNVPLTETFRGDGGPGQPENAEYGTSRNLLFELENEKRQLETQVVTLNKFKNEELMKYAAGLQLPDNGVPRLYEEYQNAVRNLEGMKASGLGRRHPDTIRIRKMSEGLHADLYSSVDSLKEILKTKLDLTGKRLESMQQVVNEKRDDAVETSLSAHEYNQARQDHSEAKAVLQNMRLEYTTKKISIGQPKNPIEIHEYPKVGKSPVSPNIKLNLVLGSVVGLLFGLVIAFALEILDTSVKSLEDVEKFLKVPVLAVIPKDVGLLHKQSGASPDAEAYRILRTNIEFNRKNPDDNAITVVSGGAGEGKSTTMVNLAYVCAQGGYTTLMIDADLRRPRLHTFFDITNTVGLTNYLTTDLLLEDVILQTSVENLFFLPSGVLPADAAGILNSRRMTELIQDVKQRFDLVLVDSPPILGVSDASVISSEVDLTMIVVQHRKLPRNMLIRVKQAVENVGGYVIGVVLNNVDVRSDSQYQYYTSYYTYYAPTNDVQTASKKKTADKKLGKNEGLKEVPQNENSEDIY